MSRLNQTFPFLYGSALFVCVVLALKCLSVSMNEPFDQVAVRELIWQLVVPSSLLTLSLVGVASLGLVSAARSLRLALAVPLALGTVFVALVAGEAIYGYLWDLRVHAGIQ